jgi:putative drug exporter of the RND superfamily
VFDRLARMAIRWPKIIVAVALVFIGLSLVYGSSVSKFLSDGGQTANNSQSSQAETVLAQKFPSGEPNFVMLVSAPQGVDDPAVAAEGKTLEAKLAAQPGVVGVSSYWSTHSTLMKATNSQSGLVVGFIQGTASQQADFVNAFDPTVDGVQGPVKVQLGGSAVVNTVATAMARSDISTAEKFGIPLTAIVLMLFFQSFLASALPLLVGIVALIGTNAVLRGITNFASVSVFALNVATGLALGLASDYGLFIIKRYRDEYHASGDVKGSVRIALNTAGRTVAYSATTVAVAMASMLVFPLYFLRSVAYTGITVVVLSAVSALVVLPAGLVLLGPKVDAWDLAKIPGWLLRHTVLRGRPPKVKRVKTAEEGGWHRIAQGVMRRPLMYTLVIAALLAVMIIPFLHVTFAMADDRILPANVESHVVQQVLRTDYDGQIANQLDIVADNVNPTADAAQITAYAERLSEITGVVRVQAVTGVFVGGRQVTPAGPETAGLATSDATYLTVASSENQMSSAGKNQVADVRAVPAPFPVLVGGSGADLVDTLNAVKSHLLWALGIIVLATMLLIFLFTGSILIPFEALLMNVLTLSATFGALTWVFQDNHLSNILSVPDAGYLDVSLLVLLFCVAFGVSMDFEVFLLSRIKEEYKRSGDSRTAIAFGIQKTGSVVTAAAVITSIVFATIGATAHLQNVKMFGAGLALALILDATVIRTVLAPALMRLAGNANWWRPAFLNGFYERFKLPEHDQYTPKPTSPGTPVTAGAGAHDTE